MALSFTAIGAVGGVAATAIGLAFGYLPRADNGQNIQNHDAALLLSLPLFLGMAYGVALLALLTGRSAASRRWPVVIAIAFAVSLIVRVTASSHWGMFDYSRWAQPWGYRIIADWTSPFAECALIVAAALGLRRIAERTGRARLNQLVRIAIVSALALMVLHLGARLHAGFARSPGPFAGGPFGNSSGAPAAFISTSLFTPTLEFLRAASWWVAISALTFLAIHVRALWRLSR